MIFYEVSFYSAHNQ